jgi:hypothetical protein
VESILLGTYDTHAEAYAALVADHGKVAPDEDMFWTRPNWTTVCDENNITWSILPVSVTPEGERVLVEEEYGPLEYEMDA